METGKSKKHNPLWTEMSRYWISACFQPWSAVANWNALMGERWMQWLSATASAPNPWLPALANERSGQRPSIDFFLPWLPHLDAVAGEVRPAGPDEAVGVMRKMTALHGSGTSATSAASPPNGLAEGADPAASAIPTPVEAVVPKRARRATPSGKQASAADAKISSGAKKAAEKGKRPAARAERSSAAHAAEDVPKGKKPSPPKVN